MCAPPGQLGAPRPQPRLGHRAAAPRRAPHACGSPQGRERAAGEGLLWGHRAVLGSGVGKTWCCFEAGRVPGAWQTRERPPKMGIASQTEYGLLTQSRPPNVIKTSQCGQGLPKLSRLPNTVKDSRCLLQENMPRGWGSKQRPHQDGLPGGVEWSTVGWGGVIVGNDAHTLLLVIAGGQFAIISVLHYICVKLSRCLKAYRNTVTSGHL